MNFSYGYCKQDAPAFFINVGLRKECGKNWFPCFFRNDYYDYFF